MEMVGAVFCKKDCATVKELLDGFGEHEKEDDSACYYDYPRCSDVNRVQPCYDGWRD